MSSISQALRELAEKVGRVGERVDGCRDDVREVKSEVSELRGEIQTLKSERDRGKGWLAGAIAVLALLSSAAGWILRVAPLALLISCANDPPGCERPHWDDRPVYVRIDQSIDAECREVIEETLLYWTDLQGVDYLDVAYEEPGWAGFHGLVPQGHIAIKRGKLSPGVGGETVWLSRLGSLVWAEITIADCDWRVPIHEIGHALGLCGHNPDEGHTMYWATGGIGSGLEPWRTDEPWPKLSPDEKEHVQ